MTAVILGHENCDFHSGPHFEAAEETARRLAITRSELYTRAIQEFIGKSRREGVTEKLNEIYASKDSSLDPLIQQLQGGEGSGSQRDE